MNDRHTTKVTGFRFTDQSILEKLNVIAKEHKRTRNQEVEWALAEYVRTYEAEHGEIGFPEE